MTIDAVHTQTHTRTRWKIWLMPLNIAELPNCYIRSTVGPAAVVLTDGGIEQPSVFNYREMDFVLKLPQGQFNRCETWMHTILVLGINMLNTWAHSNISAQNLDNTSFMVESSSYHQYIWYEIKHRIHCTPYSYKIGLMWGSLSFLELHFNWMNLL